ncbi:MAG: lysophospholipase L1-like esterase [Polaribacter sp.]
MLFIGDSITDTSRSRPIGKTIKTNTGLEDSTGLGSGFVSIINNLLISGNPQLDLTLLNLGCNGHRITDLKSRWQRDVLDLKPDWLIILIGINDVWRHFDRPNDQNLVNIHGFEKVYRVIIEESKIDIKNLVLMSPYYLEKNAKNSMKVKMIEYANIVEKLATDYKCQFINLQKEFDYFLDFRSVESFSADKIHINKLGHTIIAQSFLKAIEPHLQ